MCVRFDSASKIIAFSLVTNMETVISLFTKVSSHIHIFLSFDLYYARLVVSVLYESVTYDIKLTSW